MAKILLVEDDNNLREIYEARLQAEGYDISTARDGEEALVVAKKENPDLVISDVMMPKISGFEMLDILRNTEGLKDVKVIMLTALGQTEDQTRADKLGADRYLVKSQVTLEDIVKVSQQLLTESGAITAQAAPAAAEPSTVAAAVAPASPPPAVAVQPMPVTQPPAEAAVPVTPIEEPATQPAAEPAAAPVTPPEPASEPVAEPAPTASAEPVIPEPAPVVTPPVAEPAPLATPPEPVSAEPPAIADGQETSAQETAEVQEQIADFVQTEPASPAPAAEPVADAPAETVVPEVSTPETAPSDTSPQLADGGPAASVAPAAPTATQLEQDQVMQDAVDTLVASTAPVTPVATEAAPVTPPEPTPEPVAPSENLGEAAPVAHKKVIKPLASTDQPAKSLDQLLAEDAAKDQAMQPIVNPGPGQTATPKDEEVNETTTPKPAGTDFDPNSIAL